MISKRQAHYVNPATRNKKYCEDCVMFRPGEPHACTLVRGVIAAKGTCKHWTDAA